MTKEVEFQNLDTAPGASALENGRARAERRNVSGLGATAVLFTRGRAVNSIYAQ